MPPASAKKKSKVVRNDLIAQGRPFAEKFFGGDRVASEALALLRPQYRQCDLGEFIADPDPMVVGNKIIETGSRLKDEGSFPGGHYVVEVSLEFNESVALVQDAMRVITAPEFDRMLQRAAVQAQAGYGTLRTWGPRFASMRWLCCVWWLAARAKIVNQASAGACFGTIDKNDSDKAEYDAKHFMLETITELIHEAPLLKVIDHDLMGHGVYMNRKNEKLPRGGHNAWFRRQIQYDLACLCRQVAELPPQSLNILLPRLHILRPYGEETWMLPPTEALRHIIEGHGWMCQAEYPSIDQMPAKALVQGLVMHMDVPPPYEFDMNDPEVRAKLERGEQLGKGLQEDGLPGAIHGSVGLLFAGIMGVEKCDNAKLYPDLLQVPDFLETFLKYSTRICTLDLSGADGQLDEELLTFVPFAGPSLRFLDLEACGLDGSVVDTLVDMCEALTGLQHIDLAHNKLDAPAATMLLAALAERRVDLQTIRLDGNPVGDTSEFRQDVAGLLAARGDQVVAGGELVLYLGVDGVRWFPEPRADTLAARRRDDTLMMAATSFEELIQGAHSRNGALDAILKDARDPKTRCIAGREILEKERVLNTRILSDKMLHLYHNKIANDTPMDLRNMAAKLPELEDECHDDELEFWQGRCIKGAIRTFTHKEKCLRTCVSCNKKLKGALVAFYFCKCCSESPYCQACDNDVQADLIAKEYQKHLRKKAADEDELKALEALKAR